MFLTQPYQTPEAEPLRTPVLSLERMMSILYGIQKQFEQYDPVLTQYLADIGALDGRVEDIEAQIGLLVSGSRISLRKTFATPASTWTWVHNLGVRPTVTMTVDGEGVMIPDVNYLNDNTLTIELDSPSTGYLDIA